MARGTTSPMRVIGLAFESLVPVPVVVVAHWYGYTGPLPLWVLLGGLGIAALTQLPRFHRKLAGGDLHDRLWLQLAVHMGVSTCTIYMLGWGPLLLVGYVPAAVMHMRWSGSRAFVPALVTTLAGIGVGQFSIHQGWVFTYLDPVTAQIAGIAGALLYVMLTRQYAMSEALRERFEVAGERSEQRFRALVQHSSDMITVIDARGLVSYASPAVESSLGRRAADLIGTPGMPLIAPSTYRTYGALLNAIDRSPGGVLSTEVRIRHPDGTERWYEGTLKNLVNSPAIAGVVANQRDVTDQRRAQERLAYEASHDLLTGLDNRGAFMRHLHLALGEAAGHDGRYAGSLAVLFIDLDEFKEINDSLGHVAGDTVLEHVARLLRGAVKGGDVVGRLGGDEFGVVLPGVGTPSHAVAMARRVTQMLDEPVMAGSRSVQAAASIGIAVVGPGEEVIDADEALRRADLAMYEAKSFRTHRWQLYDDSLEPASRATPDELRHAIATGQIVLQYQPVVALPSLDMIGVEALVRWRHPERGLVGPGDFVGMAESTGVVHQLGDWVLARACTDLSVWRRRFDPARRFWVGVNVSPVQLEAERTAARFAEILRVTGAAASEIVVEVTESALVDSPTARENLATLSAAGVRIAIDDFGTGYSSLQYLTRLPVDWLKLDRSFVAELDGSPEGAAIAEAVARLGRTLRLGVTAEGVETAEGAAELASLGYRTAQGFLFGRPMDATDIEALLPGEPVAADFRDLP